MIIEKALSEGKKVAIAFNDFVYLHGMNKLIGHEKTNLEVFKPIAKIYQEAMIGFHEQGKQVFIGRYAGDSFLIIIVGEEKEEAEIIFNDLIGRERQLKRPEGAIMKPIFSHGFAYTVDMEKSEFGLLIEEADRMCEDDKRRLKDNIESRAEMFPDGNAAKFLKAISR